MHIILVVLTRPTRGSCFSWLAALLPEFGLPGKAFPGPQVPVFRCGDFFVLYSLWGGWARRTYCWVRASDNCPSQHFCILGISCGEDSSGFVRTDFIQNSSYQIQGRRSEVHLWIWRPLRAAEKAIESRRPEVSGRAINSAITNTIKSRTHGGVMFNLNVYQYVIAIPLSICQS